MDHEGAQADCTHLLRSLAVSVCVARGVESEGGSGEGSSPRSGSAAAPADGPDGADWAVLAPCGLASIYKRSTMLSY